MDSHQFMAVKRGHSLLPLPHIHYHYRRLPCRKCMAPCSLDKLWLQEETFINRILFTNVILFLKVCAVVKSLEPSEGKYVFF